MKNGEWILVTQKDGEMDLHTNMKLNAKEGKKFMLVITADICHIKKTHLKTRKKKKEK